MLQEDNYHTLSEMAFGLQTSQSKVLLKRYAYARHCVKHIFVNIPLRFTHIRYVYFAATKTNMWFFMPVEHAWRTYIAEFPVIYQIFSLRMSLYK